MDYLNREASGFSKKVWDAIDAAVVRAASRRLTARRFIEIDGPFGLGVRAAALGIDRVVLEPSVEGGTRRAAVLADGAISIPLIQERFSLDVRGVEGYDKLDSPLNVRNVAIAGESIANREEELVFYGAEPLGIPGLLTVKGNREVALSSWNEPEAAFNDILAAIGQLDAGGHTGPYALAVSPRLYNLLHQVYTGRDTLVIDHVRKLVTEGVFKAPTLLSGGVLVETTRRNLAIMIGQDLATGFEGPEGLFLNFVAFESLVPVIRFPSSICVLREGARP
jgi:uncharacterized linocin/CFP29 family protein